MIPGLTGIITGMIGTLFNGGMDYVKGRQELEKAKLDHKHELDLVDRQAKRQGDENEHELAITSLNVQSQTLMASYAHDSSIGDSYKWVNALVKLFRPALTLALAGMVYLFYTNGTIDQVYLDGSAMTARSYIVFTVCEGFAAALVWWFGDVGRSAFSRKKVS